MENKTNAQLVWEFNKAFDRPQLDELADLASTEEKDKLKSQLALIEEEVEELQDAIFNADWEGIKDAVMDILVVTYGMGYVCKVDCDEGVREVNRANMTKFCRTAKEVADTVSYYNDSGIKATIRNLSVGGEELFAVKSLEDQTDKNGKFFPKGKLLKNVNWEEPDLFAIERV